MNQHTQNLKDAHTETTIAKATVDLDVQNLRLILSQEELDLQSLGALAQIGESMRQDFDKYFDCIIRERQAKAIADYFK